MARDRSKPWGRGPDDDPEHTESAAWDDKASQGASRRRAPRRGTRRDDDETNVGGSLLPGDDFGLAAVFEQALAPAYVTEPANDEVERTEPAAPAKPSAPTPPPSKPIGAKPGSAGPAHTGRTGRAGPSVPPEPKFELPPEPTDPPGRLPALHLPTDEDLGLGPVEEFTISGLMPDELKAMADAAREATRKAGNFNRNTSSPAQARPAARNVHADPPRTSRHDPDPLITGVLAPPGGPPPGQRPSIDDEETLAMNVADHPELLEKLRAPKEKATRDYHTFGAGLQRLDQLPEAKAPKKGSEPSGGGILELLDGAPPPASPTGPNPAPGAPSRPPESDRPRRISTNRAGSMGRSGRAPTPTPARQRSVAPNPRGATPRPAPARGERDRGPREALRRSGGRPGRPSAPSKPPTPAPRPTSSGRAQDEEARIRAALASVSDDEHTSWVKFDEPELGEQSKPAAARPAGNRPRAQRPDDDALPGKTPIGMSRQEPPPPDKPGRDKSGLTMDLVGVRPAEEPTRPVMVRPDIGDEATIPNARSSLGEEVTIPARSVGDDPTIPVKVPNTRLKADAPPAAKPPPPKAPGAKPPAKKPSEAAGAAIGKPPIDISPLGDDEPESYRDGALPWIASMFAVMIVGSGVIFFLIMLLYLI